MADQREVCEAAQNRSIRITYKIIDRKYFLCWREMCARNTERETQCSFLKQSMEDAYGPEVSLLSHCHLRGYDRHGEGKYPDLEYYDKYGAPFDKNNSWKDGYQEIETKLAQYFNAVVDHDLDLPLIAGIAGAAHLYKAIHEEKPWNWTGWVPRQKRWSRQGSFFSNRYFLALRGNEIQNNLWDYKLFTEGDVEEMEYSKLKPNDRYRGGYWFPSQPFGRYLHIIAIKSHKKDPETDTCQRYNYIVHPLAYRASINTVPDNSVDAIQWCILNIPLEPHFGEGKPWGDKCHGLEIFNDFTYFHSYQTTEGGRPHNGELAKDTSRDINGNNVYYYWYDTYPLEYAVFLLDSALTRGVYFHTMAGNDAFYENHGDDEAANQPNKVVSADRNVHLLKQNRNNHKAQDDSRLGVKNADPSKDKKTDGGRHDEKALGFLQKRPYKTKIALGYVTLFDPRLQIKQTVFQEHDGVTDMRLDEGEKLVLDYLLQGRYYSSTGLWDLFNYGYNSLPYKIHNQPDPDNLCFDITDDIELVFTFLECKEKNLDLVWRYTIMVKALNNQLESTHGYFKLSSKSKTKLDLRSYEKSRVKWLYFTAIRPKNPQQRAWLHAIRGPAFGEHYHHTELPPLQHNVVPTLRVQNTVIPQSPISPTACSPGNLDFTFGTAANQLDICVYFLQVCSKQQDLTTEPVNEKIKESSDVIPPRILQSVHGYFNLRNDHPTRLNLTAFWDKETVKGQVQFYTICAETGQPRPMDVKPKHY